MARRELEVQAAWHEQVHRSKVTALACSPDGVALWSGCDAEAPRPAEEEPGGEPPAAIVDPSTGAVLSRAEDAPPRNVRLLLPLPASNAVLCATGDGALLMLSSGAAGLMARSALPGTPAAAAAAAAATASSQPATAASAPPSAAAAVAEEAGAPGDGADAGAAAGPAFVAEAGYRGHREGYLFRTGALGSGYYRKDVVRRHCPSASASASAPPVPATPPPQEEQQQRAREQQEQRGQQASAAGGSDGQLSGEAARRYIQRLLRAPPSMHCVAASADGSLLFTASLGPSDSSARVWRLQHSDGGGGSGGGVQAQLHRTLTGHTAPVLSLALSPDGALLFTGSHDASVRVWSTADWHCARVLKGHGGGVRALAVAPDGGTLYTAASDNTIRAWSTRHWVCLRTMHGRHEDTCWPACLALSPDGGLLASGSTGPFGGSTIKVFQAAGGGGGHEAGACLASLAQLGYHQKGGLCCLAFSPDGSSLYSGASDGTVAAWRLRWREAAPAAGLRRGWL